MPQREGGDGGGFEGDDLLRAAGDLLHVGVRYPLVVDTFIYREGDDGDHPPGTSPLTLWGATSLTLLSTTYKTHKGSGSGHAWCGTLHASPLNPNVRRYDIGNRVSVRVGGPRFLADAT
jgi:hypothetical protein